MSMKLTKIMCNMKILFVSNYSPWTLVSKGLMPSNHLFGIKEILDSLYVDDDGAWHGSFEGGNVDFVCIKTASIKKLPQYLALACKYDVVYDVLDVLSKFVGLVPAWIRPFKLVSILHHPPFDKQLKYSDSDAYIFFSKPLLDLAKSCSRRKQKKMYLNEWKADLDYYKSHSDVEKKYDFVDCGRTNRDHKTIVDALVITGSKALFYDKRRMKEQNDYDLHEGENTFFYKNNFIPDECYVDLMREARSMILSLPKTNRQLGPLGATVLMDALGQEMPIICSDNAYCCDIVSKNGIGLIFEAGNAKSLALCMEKLKDAVFYETCRKNIAKYNSGGGNGRLFEKGNRYYPKSA